MCTLPVGPRTLLDPQRLLDSCPLSRHRFSFSFGPLLPPPSSGLHQSPRNVSATTLSQSLGVSPHVPSLVHHQGNLPVQPDVTPFILNTPTPLPLRVHYRRFRIDSTVATTLEPTATLPTSLSLSALYTYSFFFVLTKTLVPTGPPVPSPSKSCLRFVDPPSRYVTRYLGTSSCDVLLHQSSQKPVQLKHHGHSEGPHPLVVRLPIYVDFEPSLQS